ncbi:coiled-coil domain-containing protein 169-like isoform X3 [Dermochelys coriacea]|uniref:coiled-coil domain-containing protein 169-like isoform X3 n=1 Tax=Dermochelys coriacea TaxID=27794 RepID=UPI001CA9B4AC|nr:coiled-coil domain-containing protein 169-like isoform X3 [Dermochelys coriacea]
MGPLGCGSRGCSPFSFPRPSILPPLQGDERAHGPGPGPAGRVSRLLREAMAEGGESSARGSEQLRLELGQERQMKEMLELSIFELRETITELEKRLGSVEDEDRLSSIRSFDQMPVGSLNQLLKQLEEEKRNLQNQLKDYELRLEQEAKAYHKANDERRMYLAEISQTSATLKIAKRQKTDAVQIKRENQILRRRHNVPENQRILDPKKGPIKKTAGVKQLPKLKH